MRQGVAGAVLASLLLLSGPLALRAETTRDNLIDAATRLGHEHQPQAGLELLRPFLATHPEDVEARILEVRLLAWSGQLDEARRLVSGLRESYPTNADLLVLAGDIDWYGGDVESAQERYQDALSLTPEYGDALEGVRRTEAARKRRWRIDTAMDVSWFGRKPLKDWQDYVVRIGRAVSDDTQISLAGVESHRFGLVDRYVEAGIDHHFAPWLRGWGAIGTAPNAQFHPKRRFELGTAVRVRDEKALVDATWLTFDWRKSAYRSGSVSHLAPGLQQYLFDGQVWVTGRLLRVTDENDRFHLGYETRLDWQALDWLRLFAGYSDMPETTANVTAYTNSRFGGVVVGLTPDIDLTLSGSHGNPWRRTVGAALSVRF